MDEALLDAIELDDGRGHILKRHLYVGLAASEVRPGSEREPAH